MDYPYLRTILFPYYSGKETLFLIVLIAAIWSFFWAIGSPSPYRYAFAGYVGASFVSHFASPARVQRPASERKSIEQYLIFYGFKFVETSNTWVPNWPTYLLWSHNVVKISTRGSNLIVHGPFSIIKKINDNLCNWNYGDGELR
jgi:hypothetical protein